MDHEYIRAAVRNFISKHEKYQRAGHKARSNIRMRGVVADAWNSLDQELRLRPMVRDAPSLMSSFLRGRSILGMRVLFRGSQLPRSSDLLLRPEDISRHWVSAIDASVNKPRRISDAMRRVAAERARVQLFHLCAQYGLDIAP